MSTIVIVGLADSSKERALNYVGRADTRLYGLPWDGEWYQYDLLFEMHDRSLWERRGEDYVERLANCPIPIVMHQHFPDIEQSTPFPFHDMPSCFYYNSSFAYMLATAIKERPDKIVICGCELGDEEEYSYQRPNAEYLIGYAEGHGIVVHVEQPTCIKQFMPDILFLDELQSYKGRYGFIN